MATTDADSACNNMYRIFPEIQESDSGISTSSDDSDSDDSNVSYCGGKCNLELPNTCFQLHATESTEYDEGLLPVDSFESVIDSKWDHALQNKKYDSFFDFNIAFW